MAPERHNNFSPCISPSVKASHSISTRTAWCQKEPKIQFSRGTGHRIHGKTTTTQSGFPEKKGINSFILCCTGVVVSCTGILGCLSTICIPCRPVDIHHLGPTIQIGLLTLLLLLQTVYTIFHSSTSHEPNCQQVFQQKLQLPTFLPYFFRGQLVEGVRHRMLQCPRNLQLLVAP